MTQHIREVVASESVYEILLGVERVRQPEPFIHPSKQGDCYACASTAILNHFQKERGLSPFEVKAVSEAWAQKERWTETFHPTVSNSDFWNSAVRALRLPYSLDIVVDPPIETEYLYREHMNAGPRFYTANSLVKRLRVYLEAGYLAFTSMSYNAHSKIRARGEKPYGSDHVVVIDGYRHSYRAMNGCAGEGMTSWGTYDDEIHVVCSARSTKDSYWIDVQEWVEEHGGFNMMFIRPTRNKARSLVPETKPCPEHGRKPDVE